MPQIRAVMSGASVNARPRRNASKKRGGSKIRSSTSVDAAALDPHAHRALALDAGEVVGLDRRVVLSHLAPPRGRPRAGVEGAEDALDVAVAPARARCSSGTSEAVFGVSIGPKQP